MTAQGHWALVTGGSSGIGLAFSRQLASEGYSLLLVGNRAEELSEAAETLRRESGVRVETLCIDLTGTGAAERVLAWCDSLGLSPDLLVNDAGMFFMKYLEPGNLGQARAMMRLHIEALTELCILLGSRMKERGTGQIINLSSMTARIPAPGIAVYSASKAYVKSFSRSLSYELRPYGVRVLAVCPSAIDTGLYPLGRKVAEGLAPHRHPPQPGVARPPCAAGPAPRPPLHQPRSDELPRPTAGRAAPQPPDRPAGAQMDPIEAV